jgi:hypothetical protein
MTAPPVEERLRDLADLAPIRLEGEMGDSFPLPASQSGAVHRHHPELILALHPGSLPWRFPHDPDRCQRRLAASSMGGQ